MSDRELRRYLLPTELPEVVVRRHWASLWRNTLISFGVALFGLFMLAYLPSASNLSALGGVTVLGAIGWFAWKFLDWRAERFVITDKRVLLITGLLTKRVAIMPLGKVTDLTYERTIPGRIIGYGAFVMESAGQQQALSRVDFLPTPDRLYQQVSSLLFGPRSRPTRASDRQAFPPSYSPYTEQATTPLPRLR